MKYLADKDDKRPDADQIFTNQFVGSAKLNEAEWSKVAASYDRYKPYLG
jgi:hypothetical protein